jgi:hypothetical protein
VVRGAEALGAGGWVLGVLGCWLGFGIVGCDEGPGDFDELSSGGGVGFGV